MTRAAEGLSEGEARVAALYDVHGNVTALDAVLEDVEAAAPDLVVVGGDVIWGSQPAEALERLLALGDRARFLRGNCEPEVAERRSSSDDDTRNEWTLWCADRLTPAQLEIAMAWPEQLRIEIAGLGRTLFCHGSPRSDTEILTRDSSEQRVAEALAGVEETVVVCGHTHVQFDRRAAGHRIVNAGSVGMAYEGEPGVACWVLLGPDVELRRSRFDPYAAAQAMRDTGMPAVEEFVHATVLEPSTAADASREFENMATSRA